jgi:hypothetical protein
MKINEIITPELERRLAESEVVWARRPPKKGRASPIKTKIRCGSGPRKGRRVSSAKDCDKPINVGQRNKMKLTRAKTKIMQARRTKRTKRINPAFKLMARLNKLKDK